MEDTRGWAVAQGTTGDDTPLIVRLKRFEADFPRHRYPHRLDISWPASADAVDGLPTPADMAAMQSFENRLCAVVEPDAQSTLCLVLTGAGEREWIFYTRDQNEFVRRLGNMPHDDAPYPLRIEYEHDPEWLYFAEFLPQPE